MNKCPCCGGVLDDAQPVVDLNTNTVLFADKTVRVQPQEAELLQILIDSFPGTISRDRIIQRMWGLGEPHSAANILSVRVTMLRRKIAPLGLAIRTFYNTGLKLELPKERLAA